MTRILVALLFILSTPTFAELTSEDIDKIREVIKQENAVIQSEMVQLELRITQKIQESENRLQSELNAQLNARMNDFTIVFAITSGGFFLMFATILILNMVKGRTIVEKKAIILLVLSVTFGTICYASSVKAQSYTRFFDSIQCKELIVADQYGRPAITLNTSNKTENSIVIHDKTGREGVAIYAGADANGISFFDKSRNARMILAHSEGSQMITMRDHIKRNAIVIAASPTRENSINVYGQGRMPGAIALKDEEGNYEVVLSTHRSIGNMIMMNNHRTGKPAINLLAHRTLGTGINVYNQMGNKTWSTPPREANPDKEPTPKDKEKPTPKLPPPTSDWLLNR